MRDEQGVVEAKVKEVMASLFSLDMAEICELTSIETVEKWDSLQHVNLIMALEKEFGVTIDVDDAVSMISFPDVCRALARYLG